jgi:putative ABC transport system permease protein
MFTLKLACKSLLNRRLTTTLTILSVALSVALLVGVERVRQGARESFTNTISQTDLIVGAKGGTIQLLLYAVFRMGSATANVTYETYKEIATDPVIAWTIPYSLGDSHRGYRVVGTTKDFYDHYHYRRDKGVEFARGQFDDGLFSVTLGSEVAAKLHYKIGDQIVLAHGVSDVSFQKHNDKPFKVTGILARTSTPIDRSVYISLEGLEAIHMDWQDGAPPLPGHEVSASQIAKEKIKIGQITAFLVGTKSRFETLRLQRSINDYQDEALMAIIPGVALSELWDGISYAEDGLRVVSAFVVIVGLLGMLVSIYNSLNERRREMAILRSVGAGPKLIFSLLIIESLLITAIGSALGVIAMYGLLFLLRPIIENTFGLFIPIDPPQLTEWLYLGAIITLGFIMGWVPAWRAYRNTLNDGLTIRV